VLIEDYQTFKDLSKEEKTDDKIKDFKFMKLIELLMLSIVTLIIGFSFTGVIHDADAFEPFGQPSIDGSAIQVFYTEDNKCSGRIRDIRIPQDSDFLDWDYFCLYVAIPDDSPRFVIVDFFEPETISIERYDDNAQAYISVNITTFSKLISSTNITLYRGQNEFNDRRFALLKVTSNQINGFLASDIERLFVVKYNELSPIEFKHQTSFDKVPITQTRGDINSLILAQIGFLVISIFVSVIASRWVYFKVGNIFPNFSVSTLLLLVTWFIFIMFAYVYVQTNSVSETVRQLSIFRPEIVSLLIAGYMFLWLPAQYRPKTLGESLLIALDIPFVSAKDIKDTATKGDLRQSEIMSLLKYPKSKRKKLYSYIDKDGKKQYAKNPDSYLDLISRLLFGGLKLDFDKTLIIPDVNGKDELIFVFNYKETPSKFITKDQKQMVYLGTIAGILISIPLAIFFWNAIIILTATLILFLIVFYAYMNITTKYAYDLTKCSRNVLSAMYDAKTVKALDNELDILLHENMQLEREKMLSVTEAKGEWMFDWENELFADDFELLFGKPFTQKWDTRMQDREDDREAIRRDLFKQDANKSFS